MEIQQLAKHEFELFDVRFLNWWRVFLGLQLFLFSLMIGSLGTSRWVEQGQGETHWKGSVLECYSCPGNWTEKSYADIADQECGISGAPHTGLCDQFESLRDAGQSFVALEVLSLVCLIAWSVRIILELLNKPILPNEIIYAIPVIGTGLHLAALIQWCLVANSFYDKDCPDLTDGNAKTKLCSLDGPILALIVGIVYPLLAFAFFVVFSMYNQNESTEKKEDVSTGRSDIKSFV